MSETVRANSRYGSLTGSHVIGRYPVERCHLHWPWVTLNRQRSIRHADSPGEGRVSRVQQIHPKRRGPSCATNFWGSLCTPSRSSNPFARGRCPKISKFGALRIHPHGLTEKSNFATWPNYIGEGNLVYSYTPPPDAIDKAGLQGAKTYDCTTYMHVDTFHFASAFAATSCSHVTAPSSAEWSRNRSPSANL